MFNEELVVSLGDSKLIDVNIVRNNKRGIIFIDHFITLVRVEISVINDRQNIVGRYLYTRQLSRVPRDNNKGAV